MPSTNTVSEMLAIRCQDGRRGWLFGERLIWAVAGGDGTDDDPKPGEGDPPKDGGSSDDGDDFDKDRALATIRKLREAEREGKATKKQLDDALGRLKAIEDKDKSETERAAATAKEATEKLTAAEQRSQDLAIRLAVERAARKLNFIDEDDAFRLIERSAVEMDAGGDPQNVEALLKDLAKAKPHLVKSDNGNGGTRSVPATGKPGPPAGRSEDVAARVEKLKASGAYSRF
jgi:hypothetical protein